MQVSTVMAYEQGLKEAAVRKRGMKDELNVDTVTCIEKRKQIGKINT